MCGLRSRRQAHASASCHVCMILLRAASLIAPAESEIISSLTRRPQTAALGSVYGSGAQSRRAAANASVAIRTGPVLSMTASVLANLIEA